MCFLQIYMLMSFCLCRMGNYRVRKKKFVKIHRMISSKFLKEGNYTFNLQAILLSFAYFFLFLSIGCCLNLNCFTLCIRFSRSPKKLKKNGSSVVLIKAIPTRKKCGRSLHKSHLNDFQTQYKA